MGRKGRRQCWEGAATTAQVGAQRRLPSSPGALGLSTTQDPLNAELLQQKEKGLKEPVIPLLWALESRFPGPTPGDSDSWVLGGAQESLLLTRFKRPLFWL